MINNGKIGRLPRDLREELNLALHDGIPGDQLLAQLNALPEVQAVLQEHFDSVPISPQNLSEWRQRGFADWRARRELYDDSEELNADAGDYQQVTASRLTDSLATVLAVRYASLLKRWDGEPTDAFERKLKSLRHLSHDIVAMRKAECHTARLQLERDKIEAKRELLGQPPRPKDAKIKPAPTGPAPQANRADLVHPCCPKKHRFARTPATATNPAIGDDQLTVPADQSDPVKPNQTNFEASHPESAQATSDTPTDGSAEFIPLHHPNTSERPESPAAEHILMQSSPNPAIGDGQLPVPADQSNPVKPNQTNFEPHATDHILMQPETNCPRPDSAIGGKRLAIPTDQSNLIRPNQNLLPPAIY